VSLRHTEQRAIHYMFLTQLNVTSGNSFCGPCCLNVALVLSLRAETCRIDMALTINVFVSWFLCDILYSWILADGYLGVI